MDTTTWDHFRNNYQRQKELWTIPWEPPLPWASISRTSYLKWALPYFHSCPVLANVVSFRGEGCWMINGLRRCCCLGFISKMSWQWKSHLLIKRVGFIAEWLSYSCCRCLTQISQSSCWLSVVAEWCHFSHNVIFQLPRMEKGFIIMACFPLCLKENETDMDIWQYQFCFYRCVWRIQGTFHLQ